MMSEQHPIGRCQSQGVTGRFFPRQMFGSRHQLLRLHARELSKRTVWCFISPDALTGGKHRITAIAVFIVTIILVAMNDNFIANLPTRYLIANGPNDTRRVRTCDVIGLFVPVKGANRCAQCGPNTIIVHACGHHQNQHIMTV